MDINQSRAGLEPDLSSEQPQAKDRPPDKSSDQELYLTVVLPAYNEEQRLPDTLGRVTAWLEQQPFLSEVVVVDDGSQDQTAALVRRLMAEREVRRQTDSHVCRLRLIQNQHRGKGYTVRTGMLQAQGRHILFSDADLSTPIEDASELLRWLEDGYDMAIGSREGQGARRYNEPAYRHLMGRGFNLLVRVVTFSRFQDTQCGFKAFTRACAHDVFRHVQLYGENAQIVQGAMVTGFDVEVLFLAVKRGYRVREVPVRWYHVGGSKVSPLKDSLRMFRDIVRVRWNDLRGRYNK